MNSMPVAGGEGICGMGVKEKGVILEGGVVTER